MKFSDKYPDMKYIVDEFDGIIRGSQAHNCEVCGNETQYIDIDSEGYFCSEECLDLFYEEFMVQTQIQFNCEVGKILERN